MSEIKRGTDPRVDPELPEGRDRSDPPERSERGEDGKVPDAERPVSDEEALAARAAEDESVKDSDAGATNPSPADEPAGDGDPVDEVEGGAADGDVIDSDDGDRGDTEDGDGDGDDAPRDDAPRDDETPAGATGPGPFEAQVREREPGPPPAAPGLAAQDEIEPFGPQARAVVVTTYLAWLLALLIVLLLSTERMQTLASRQPYGPVRDGLVVAADFLDATASLLGLDVPARSVALALGRATPEAAATQPPAPPEPPTPAFPTLTAEDLEDALAGEGRADAEPSADEPARDAARDARATREARRATAEASAPTRTPRAAATRVGDADEDDRETARGGEEDAAPGRRPAGGDATRLPMAAGGARPFEAVWPGQPLRVLVAGDSFAQPIGYELDTYALRDGMIETALEFELSSGLVRQDFFDWPARIEALARGPERPEVLVFIVGANEPQNMETEDGYALVHSPEWRAEYGRRAARIMDGLEEQGVTMIWIGMPVMRDEAYTRVMQDINAAVSAEADRRDWVHFLDIEPMFADEDGGFTSLMRDGSGQVVEIRQSDGVHLTRLGSNWVTAEVYGLLSRLWDLSTPPPPEAPPPTVEGAGGP